MCVCGIYINKIQRKSNIWNQARKKRNIVRGICPIYNKIQGNPVLRE